MCRDFYTLIQQSHYIALFQPLHSLLTVTTLTHTTATLNDQPAYTELSFWPERKGIAASGSPKNASHGSKEAEEEDHELYCCSLALKGPMPAVVGRQGRVGVFGMRTGWVYAAWRWWWWWR